MRSASNSMNVSNGKSLARPSWFRGMFRGGRPIMAARIADSELRQIGHVHPTPSNVYLAEEFRIIKRQLVANVTSQAGIASTRDPRVVLVASAAPGEGKTFTSFNLALSLAIEPDCHVTLIDAEIGSQGLTKKLRLTGERGLLDMLEQGGGLSSEYVQQTNISNLDVIPSGSLRSTGPELVGGARMSGLLSQITSRGAKNFVVLDSRSVLSGSSAISLAEHAGQVLFVLAARETSSQEVRQSLNLIESAVGPLDEANIGFILNKANPNHSAARYAKRR